LPEKFLPFKLNAEHVALDFVNTLDDRFASSGPQELIFGYADLLRFCRQAGILTHAECVRLNALPAASQKQALQAALELREILARICYSWLEERSPDSKDRLALEQWAVRCLQHRQLRWRDSRLVWEWKRLENEADMPTLFLAQAAVELLTADPPPRLHACASATCRWLFLDTSRNRTRRWCDMKICGNRAKARRFSAAHRD
jgi:predicted RNA-binding Zn ribbon-like protein